MERWTFFMSSITPQRIHDNQINHLPVYDAKVASRQFNDPPHTLTNETAGVSLRDCCHGCDRVTMPMRSKHNSS